MPAAGGPLGGDPDDPCLKRSAMANVLATGADPALVELLVQHGARRPQLEGAPGGGLVYVAPSGERQPLTNLRALQMGPGVFDLRAKRHAPGGAAASGGSGGGGGGGGGGCVDERFEKYLCGSCGAPPAIGTELMRCGRCRSVAYCGKECQRAHWKQHKGACKAAGEEE